MDQLPRWVLRHLKHYRLDGHVHAVTATSDGAIWLDLALSTSQNLSNDIIPFTRAVGGSLQNSNHTASRSATTAAQLRVIIPPPRSWHTVAWSLVPPGVATLATTCLWHWLRSRCDRSL